MLNSVLKRVSDIKELGKTQKLEDFIDLGLDLKQHKIAPTRFHGFEKRGE